MRALILLQATRVPWRHIHHKNLNAQHTVLEIKRACRILIYCASPRARAPSTKQKSNGSKYYLRCVPPYDNQSLMLTKFRPKHMLFGRQVPKLVPKTYLHRTCCLQLRVKDSHKQLLSSGQPMQAESIFVIPKHVSGCMYSCATDSSFMFKSARSKLTL